MLPIYWFQFIRNEKTLLNAGGNTIIPKDLTVNGNIINSNLQNELNNRSLTTHTHTYGVKDIVNLQTELNNRSLTTHTHNYAFTNHIHSEYSLTTHTHKYGIHDIATLQTELNNRSLITHTHTYGINDITNLQQNLITDL